MDSILREAKENAGMEFNDNLRQQRKSIDELLMEYDADDAYPMNVSEDTRVESPGCMWQAHGETGNFTTNYRRCRRKSYDDYELLVEDEGRWLNTVREVSRELQEKR